ncbi:hypothetical protein BJ138DRAFT_1009500 [Hygrophoropsis aurantiaca]|uniref:Uncharacterized protein n=1 Tax=Hygrophoropsis aurantiaca TaxID=72124 RepID=A0ACB8AA28_9AGAM|nr:hypothetical protein BJ138DRAFT_1009500 [Hygrophoropsis aurantiaca]
MNSATASSSTLSDTSPSSSILPNPYTPLAWLEPSLAAQFEASCYLYVAVLGAFIWDWLIALPEEYRMIRTSKLRLPIIMYYVSRFGALAWIMTNLVSQVGSVPDCEKLQNAIGASYVFASPSTSALFFFRVRAVFDRSKIVIACFAIMWLGVLGSSFLVPFAIQAQHIGNTQRCINSSVKNWAGTPIITNTIYATLVFLAISLKLMSMTMIDSPTGSDRVKSFIRGDGLPRFSRLLFKSGQQYYFATFGTNILALLMILLPTTPPVFQAMFTIPSVALESSMACRVFRSVKLGVIMDSPTTMVTEDSSVTFRPRPRQQSNSVITYPLQTFNERRPVPVNVSITRTTDTINDGISSKNITFYSQDDGSGDTRV